MVAKATHRKAVPVYEARGFRGAETVGALVALLKSSFSTESTRKRTPANR